MFSTPQLLTDGWVTTNAAGQLAVQIPGSATAGTHRIAVYNDADEVIGWASIQVTAVDNGGDLAATGFDASAFVVTAFLLLLAGGGALAFTRRRRREEQAN